MNPLVRALGKVLRLVGISSPEDSLPREKTLADPPSWRDHPDGPDAPSTRPGASAPPADPSSR